MAKNESIYKTKIQGLLQYLSKPAKPQAICQALAKSTEEERNYRKAIVELVDDGKLSITIDWEVSLRKK